MTDLDSQRSHNPQPQISTWQKAKMFENFHKSTPKLYIVCAFFLIFDGSKILTNLHHSYVKLDERKDGAINELVQATITPGASENQAG